MTRETGSKQTVALAAKKFYAQRKAAARTKHVRATARLLTPWKPFGNPSLLPGEKATAFQRLLAEAAEEYRPRTLQQRLMVWDIVMATWQIERLRRIEVGLVGPPDGSSWLEEGMAVSFRRSIDAIELTQKLSTGLQRRRDALFRELARLQAGPNPDVTEPAMIDLASQEVDDD